ncbi:MAG: Gfo/Idh/MocA family protein [Kiritimatiellia bacterium]|jgi:predicted dehydrogenase
MKTRVAILKDSATRMLGLHGLHVAFRGLPNVEVVAHVDSNPADIDRKMALTQARRHYADYIEMLDKERPDIVVLCSRHPADHLAQIEVAAERGCHIFCEKPLAADLLEADRIVDLVDRHGIKLCVAHPARYSLPYLAMKAMIERGDIGTPFTAYGRGKCDHRGGGEDLMVLGTHILDLQVFLFGAPTHVWADVKTDGRPLVQTDRTDTVEPLGPTAGDDVFACINYPNGVRGVFESRRGIAAIQHGIVQMGLAVAGTEGVLSMPFNDAAKPVAKLRRSRFTPPLAWGIDYEDVPLVETRVAPGAEPLDFSLCGQPGFDVPSAPFFMETHRFAVLDLMQAIADDRQPVSNAREARTTLEIIYAIYASSLTGRAIPIPLQDRGHPLVGADASATRKPKA